MSGRKAVIAPVHNDVHRLGGLRRVDPVAADAAVVRRQPGPLPGPPDPRPDTVVRFVDELPTTSRVRPYAGEEPACTRSR